VCGNNSLVSVLDLGLHPMCDDLVSLGEPRSCKEYPVEIMFCEKCCTAHQRFPVPKQELFPSTYHYRSRFTADVLSGMAGLVELCGRQFGSFAGKTVLDIGCNDGSLLDFFRLQGAKTIGVEPTGAGGDAAQKGHTIFSKFLSEDLASEIVSLHGNPSFITFTNVFAHIEDLSQVLKSLRRLMAKQTVIVIENHYLGSVLDGNQFDTFYHEHPRTYSCSSFTYIARSLGLDLLDVQFPSRYGGNIRVFLGKASIFKKIGSTNIETLTGKESNFKTQFSILTSNIQLWKERKSSIITDHVNKYGKLRAKAFPGRAAILVKLLGLNEEIISAVFEKPGSLKIGHYLPGTRIPIQSDDDLFLCQDKTLPLLNLAWHIPNEIRAYMNNNSYTGPIIEILSPDDFIIE
jgi:hypothetical protein